MKDRKEEEKEEEEEVEEAPMAAEMTWYGSWPLGFFTFFFRVGVSRKQMVR